jgi:hypothetical protein
VALAQCLLEKGEGGRRGRDKKEVGREGDAHREEGPVIWHFQSAHINPWREERKEEEGGGLKLFPAVTPFTPPYTFSLFIHMGFWLVE